MSEASDGGGGGGGVAVVVEKAARWWWQIVGSDGDRRARYPERGGWFGEVAAMVLVVVMLRVDARDDAAATLRRWLDDGRDARTRSELEIDRRSKVESMMIVGLVVEVGSGSCCCCGLATMMMIDRGRRGLSWLVAAARAYVCACVRQAHHHHPHPPN